jgi:hypothetical protein
MRQGPLQDILGAIAEVVQEGAHGGLCDNMFVVVGVMG